MATSVGSTLMFNQVFRRTCHYSQQTSLPLLLKDYRATTFDRQQDKLITKKSCDFLVFSALRLFSLLMYCVIL